MKKIMTYDDLLKFCEEQNFTEFNADESGYQLCISVPAQFEQEDSDDESMMFANIKVFHTNKNNNGSDVTKEAMKNSLSGFKYKPILCNYQTVTLEDGTEALDFTAHDMEIDEDGNVVYIEKQVGCITADEPIMKYDRKNKRYYAYAKCAIPREYTPAAEIIERRGGTDVSAELYVNKMSYDAKKKELLLEDIELAGVTLLGADRRPGMSGAHLQLEDFAADENISFEQNDKLIETLENLNKTLEELKINNAERKEEKPMDKFEELLEKYNKTAEDVTFDHEGMSDEELETAFAEAFAEQDDNSGQANPEAQQFDDADPDADPETDGLDDAEDEDADEDSDQGAADDVTAMIEALPENPDANDQYTVQAARDAYNGLTDAQKELVEATTVSALEDAEEAVVADKDAIAKRDAGDEPATRRNNELTYSVVIDGTVKQFSVSLTEKLNALRDLVNNTYSESDNAWYDVDAYDDEKYVVMHDYWNNKHYRQNYSVKKDVYSLKGDRVEVFARFLTQDEINSLSSMKSNYEQIEKDLMQYQKKELVGSSDYSAISDKEEFVAVVNDVNNGKNEMTFEELKENLDKMLLNYAKSGNLNFEAVEDKAKETEDKKPSKKFTKVGLVPAGAKGNPKKSRYGNIFKKR